MGFHRVFSTNTVTKLRFQTYQSRYFYKKRSHAQLPTKKCFVMLGAQLLCPCPLFQIVRVWPGLWILDFVYNIHDTSISRLIIENERFSQGQGCLECMNGQCVRCIYSGIEILTAVASILVIFGQFDNNCGQTHFKYYLFLFFKTLNRFKLKK